MTGKRGDGTVTPLRAVPAPEYTLEERRAGLARLAFLQCYEALLRNDPDAEAWLTDLFTQSA